MTSRYNQGLIFKNNMKQFIKQLKLKYLKSIQIVNLTLTFRYSQQVMLRQLIFLFLVLNFQQIITISNHQFAYTVRYIKSFSQNVNTLIGCNEKNRIYGNYLYPDGPSDILAVILNPNIYRVVLNCSHQNISVKVFGSGQNYDELLKADAFDVAKTLMEKISYSFVIDWKKAPSKQSKSSQKWLNKFVQKLISQGKKFYIKAPASYFCYQIQGQPYLLSLSKATQYIIEMYGQQAGIYTTYKEIFQKQSPRDDHADKNQYSQKCPKYPSISTLNKNYPQKKFYLQKTLHKQEAGYIGPMLDQFLNQSKSIYDKIVFYDSLPFEIIPL